MKTRAVVIWFLAASVTALAQSDYSASRVSQQADELKRATARLAERALQDLVRGYNNSQSDIDDALRAQHMDASMTLFVEMARNRRPLRELRDTALALNALVRPAPTFSPHTSLWRTVQTELNDLNRQLGGGWPGATPGPAPKPIIGRVAWRGVVDDRVQLVIQAKTIEVKVISGMPQPAGTFAFTSALPTLAVEVEVTKDDGRGQVRVLQQPSKANGYTAVVEIYDNSSGTDEYRLDIVWR